MTGGGFYVVSFVSCSSCFMLKFSGRYVIKLLGVWRAQAPLFLITGDVPAVGQMCVTSLRPPSLPLSMALFGSILDLFFIRKLRYLPLWGGNWSFRVTVAPLWILSSGHQLSTPAEPLVWKWPNPPIAVGLGWLWEEPADKGACCTVEIKLLQSVHPPFCLPRDVCCDFSPTTFVLKSGLYLGLRFLFSLSVHKCLQT